MNIEIPIGIAAGICTSIALLPQLLKIYEERKAAGIPPLISVILFFGIFLWIGYGIIKADIVIILANVIALLININIYVLNKRYKQEETEKKLQQCNHKPSPASAPELHD